MARRLSCHRVPDRPVLGLKQSGAGDEGGGIENILKIARL